MSGRRKLTSSERHGVIALAVVMIIVVTLMAIDRGIFRPKITELGHTEVADTIVTRNDYSTVTDSVVNEKPHRRGRKRKEPKKERTKLPAGRQRNHLDESAE